MARPIVHGHKTRDKVSPTYRSWKAARERCNNPNHVAYPRYGGVGVKMAKVWDTFQTFLNDLGERPEGMTLDRIDNAKGYEPGNCRWSTWLVQASNRRPRVARH